jgi:DNA-binding LacI/PurR family transcriptional regulator
MDGAHRPSRDVISEAQAGSPRQREVRLTIREVAQAAGVSPATVSRALRGLGNVDERTRDRIVAIARELNYSVSPTASRLASGRTGTIGIVTPYVGRWYFTEVFAGIEERLKPFDVDLLLHHTDEEAAVGGPEPATRLRRRVDGAIIVGMSPDPGELAELTSLGIPMVLLGARHDGIASVAIDDQDGARKAVGHLVDLGHERIGIITGRALPTHVLPENHRLAGYLDVLAEHDIRARPEFRVIGGFTTEGGERAMDVLLARRPRPSAVFCMSDEMAYGALRAMRRAGVPAGGRPGGGGIAVVGFDGHDLAEVFDLSTVAQPVRDLGRAAADVLMSMVHGDKPARPEELEMATELHVRGSTAP